MIRINYEDKKDEIEKVYWKWFKTYHLQRMINIMKNDQDLQKIIFYKNKKDYNQYISDKLEDDEISNYIKSFLFMPPEEHFTIINSKCNFKINNTSKDFFLNNYKNFRKTQCYKIIDKLDIKSCPYCNRNFIDIYYRKKDIPFRFNGDLDHYFAKDAYPYLAISLYNLIPSCKTCNHEKHDKIELVFHPYLHSHINLYSFSTSFDLKKIDITYLYGLSDKFEIKIEANDLNANSQYIKNSKKVFFLDEKYESMKEYTKNIINKTYVYNHGILNEFSKNLVDNDGNELFNEEELKKIIFNHSLDEELHLDNPLSKLTYDILKEFNIIE